VTAPDLFHSTPDANTLAYYAGLLDAGTITRGDLAISAAELPVNLVNIGFDTMIAFYGLQFV
jgi:hypothetical protein